jgi:mannitol-specific phosphotransferase system IIBC component
MNPDGNTEEHLVLVRVEAVPFPYMALEERTGAAVVAATGTTVAVLRITTGVSVVSSPATWVAGDVASAPASVVHAQVLPATAALVTVTVTAAAVTVTVAAAQLEDPAAEETTVM